MRFCVESTDNFYPFYLEKLLLIMGSRIKKYNWIFSDLEAHLLSNEERLNSLLNKQEPFYLSGEELYSVLKSHNILMVFGVVTAVNKKVNFNEIQKFPTINNNEFFWEDNYDSPIPGYEIEFGFFDNNIVVISTKNFEIVKDYKESVPGFLNWDTYVQRN